MPVIKVAIGKSIYDIDCPEGQEENIKNKAAQVNQRVNRIAIADRSVDEKTALMLCAMELEGQENKSSNQSGPTEDDLYDAVSENMDNIADYIDKLVNKINNL